MMIVTTVQDHFVTLNGLRVHYREWGAKGAPALVILHGATVYARYYDDVARVLAARWHVLVPDLRGHGETDWAADYTTETFVQDVELLTEHLDLPRFALVGFSLGATVAYHYAARHPDRVERLVLWDIGPDLFSTPLLESMLAQLEALGLEVFDDPKEPLRRAIAAAAPTIPEERVRAGTAYNLVQAPDGRWRWRYDAAGLGATHSVGRDAEVAAWAALAQLRCPTLLGRAENSPILSRENAERLVRSIANGRWVEVPASGHDVVADNLAGFLAVVEPFLFEQPGWNER